MGESGEGEEGEAGEEEASPNASRVAHTHFVSPKLEREWPWYRGLGGGGRKEPTRQGPIICPNPLPPLSSSLSLSSSSSLSLSLS